MKQKAKNALDSMSYYANKHGWANVRIIYRSGHRTDFSLVMLVGENINIIDQLNTFGLSSQRTGESEYLPNINYRHKGMKLTVRSKRRKTIDCLDCDGEKVTLYRTPNQDMESGFTEIVLNYTGRRGQYNK